VYNFLVSCDCCLKSRNYLKIKLLKGDYKMSIVNEWVELSEKLKVELSAPSPVDVHQVASVVSDLQQWVDMWMSKVNP
jgi:hypothetical protein